MINDCINVSEQGIVAAMKLRDYVCSINALWWDSADAHQFARHGSGNFLSLTNRLLTMPAWCSLAYISGSKLTGYQSGNLLLTLYLSFIYSKTSLNRPLTVVNSCGPFMEVIDLQNFPQHKKIRYF